LIRFSSTTIGEREIRYVTQVLASGSLTKNIWCERFGLMLSRYIGRQSLPVSSGTAALHLALLGCGVGPGDEVIVPATTFVATANAVLYCGATPVVGDVHRFRWTLDIDRAAGLITPNTKAIIPVHLYGTPADDLSQVAADHYARTGSRIFIVEDCAEALGGEHSGLPVGSRGDVAAFSFYGSKTATCGEGGVVACSDSMIFNRVEHLAGQAMTSERYVHDALGFNYRMTEMQAAVGCAQIEQLDDFLAKRRLVFDWYDQYLDESFMRQSTLPGDVHGAWAYAVYKTGMDAIAVAEALWRAGIETRPVFPPVSEFAHVADAMRGRPEVLYIANALRKSAIVLPTHCGLRESDVEGICRVLNGAACSL
jgi:perosamine synthetase